MHLPLQLPGHPFGGQDDPVGCAIDGGGGGGWEAAGHEPLHGAARGYLPGMDISQIFGTHCYPFSLSQFHPTESTICTDVSAENNLCKRYTYKRAFQAKLVRFKVDFE